MALRRIAKNKKNLVVASCIPPLDMNELTCRIVKSNTVFDFVSTHLIIHVYKTHIELFYVILFWSLRL